jgi:DNA-binding beta-propeller fold protein YncE
VVETSSPSVGANTIDLNFSPNIVITPDSSRGFVSYPGSDQVLVFDPKTGEIIKLIEVGPNPGQITLTPDGKHVLLPCTHLEENMPTLNSPGALIASLARINVDTLETRTSQLSEVFLSIANNILISEDGRTGFLASLVTDELIRFDVETLQEIGDRLEFTPGTRPSTLTMAPDHSFIAVVLIGSTSLPRDEFPDSVTLVDPTNFTILEQIIPATGRNSEPDAPHILHDFTAVTLFSISKDGRYGLIADQQISNLSPLPSLASDRAWLWDFETSQFANPIPVAGISAGCYYAPTGEFVLIGALGVSFIDPVEGTSDTVLPTRSNFRSRSAPAFSNDGKLMFLAAPMNDSILTFDLESHQVLNAVEIGGDVEREVGRQINGELTTGVITYSSAPLYLSLVPDGDVLATVNFNANTVELLENSDRFFVAEFLSSTEGEDGEPGFFTGLALTNISDEETDVILSAYSGSGFLYTDNLQTDDIVEFENPASLQLAPDTQMARTLAEFFQIDLPSDGGGNGSGEGDGGDEDEEDDTPITSTSVTGWLDIDTNQPDLGAFSLIGNNTLTLLDGSVAIKGSSPEIVLPEVRYEEDFKTEITVLNPHLANMKAFVQLVNDKGQLVEEFSRALPPRTSFTRFVKDPDPDTSADIGIFPESAFEPCSGGSGGGEDEGDNQDEEDGDGALHCGFEKGYLIVKAAPLNILDSSQIEEGERGPSVVASERYYDSDRMAVLNGFSKATDLGQDPARYYLPQVTSFDGSQTFIQLVNPTSEWLNLSLTLKDDQGQNVAPPASVKIRSGHSLKESLRNLFSLTDPGYQVSGWVLVESDKPGLVGDAELQLFEGQAMTTVPLQYAPASNLLFSHVAQGLGMSTGFAIINTEDVAANVGLSVFDPDGNMVEHTEFSIPPRGRDTRLLKEYFSDFGEQLGGYITLDSDREVVGLELFYADNLAFISAVLPQ